MLNEPCEEKGCVRYAHEDGPHYAPGNVQWWGKVASTTAPQPSVNVTTTITGMTEPTEAQRRKATPIWTGVIQYFPLVWAEIAKVSKLGNDQHNPGQPLHWAREKSTDQMDSAFRHMLDYAAGNTVDDDGAYHLAKAIWRLCAEFELALEKGRDGEAKF